MKLSVFIQTNHRQRLAALVSQHSLRRNSAENDAFDVQIMNAGDFDFLQEREGQSYLRAGKQVVWRNDDLQSFTPLRFMPPQLMDYQGRAAVIDPDIFAVGDIHELLTRDMDGKAILCRRPPQDGGAKTLSGSLPSSVMLLDCARLTHWRPAERFAELFRGETDYADWMTLRLEDRASIGFFEDGWNDFDRLTPETKLLHNTRRRTQPWKTGLPIDFAVDEKTKKRPPVKRLLRAARRLFGEASRKKLYQPHDDPRQEALFFGLLRECLDKGVVTEALLRDCIERKYLRPDAFAMLERAPALAA